MKRTVWVAGGAVVLLLALGVVGWRALTADAGEKPAAAVTVAADRGPVTVQVATSGTIEPATTRSLSFTVAGEVTSVSVRAGSVVKAGQKLASVDSGDAADAVDKAADTLSDARSALSDAQDAADKPQTCTAQQGTGTAQQGTGGQGAAAPMPSGSASRSPSPTRSASPSPTRAQTAAPSASPSCATTQRTGGSQGDAIFSAQERVNQAETTLEEAQEELDGATITAPIAGTVLSVAGSVGSQAGRGSTFISLADTYSMQVSAEFPEADAGAIAVGQAAALTLADSDSAYPAKVVQVDPAGTVNDTMVEYGVRLSFTKSPADLLVGQSAQVRVTTGSVEEALRVPSTAVHNVSAGAGTVRIAGADRRVRVGVRGDQYTQIKSGLTAGEQVVRSW
jgi:HlyD family secretion protein